jgi:integrase/recombinase XerD
MNGTTPNTLGRALRGFFSDHLPRVRGASCQTVQSYRDTFVLQLRFVAAQRPASVTKLDLEDLGPKWC